MTIKEYLNQLPKLKYKAETATARYEDLVLRATAPGCALDLGDTGRRIRGSGNATENKLIEMSDAGKKSRAANERYYNFRDQLEKDIDNLLYWQGCLIYQCYIYNVIIEADDNLKGAADILRTTSRREILAKLAEAERALADILQARGLDIEN